MEYVGAEQPKDQGCLFCQAAATPDDPRLQVLFHNDQALVMMNKYPYSNGHIMVVPKRHISQLEELNQAEKLAMMDLLAHGSLVLKKALCADGLNAGFNLGKAAGAGIPGHLHLHLVPRWNNDVNFMTVLADVRTIPEHLEITYKKLKTYFAQMEDNSNDGVY